MSFQRDASNRIANKILENVPHNHFTPRHFHLDLLDSALSANTIICTSKESTKFFIALSLIRSLGGTMDGKWTEEASRGLYLSDAYNSWTVVSVLPDEQIPEICEYLLRHTGWAIAGCPSTEASEWPADKWSQIVADHRVLVISASLFVEDLMPLSVLPLSKVSCLIVDACETGLIEGSPLSRIMEVYRSLKPEAGDSRPHILGLSSTLMHIDMKNPLKVEQDLGRLEEVMCSRAETASDMLSMFTLGARPKERVIVCPRPNNQATHIGRLVARLLADAANFLHDVDFPVTHDNDNGPSIDLLDYCIRAVEECMGTLRRLGVWCCHIISRVFVKHLLNLETTHKVEDEPARLLRYTASQLAMVTRLFLTAFDNIKTLDEFSEFITPKVHQLVRELKIYRPTLDFTIEGVDPAPSSAISVAPSDVSSIADSMEMSAGDSLSSDSSFSDSDGEVTDEDLGFGAETGGPTVRCRAAGAGTSRRRRRGSRLRKPPLSSTGPASRSSSVDSASGGPRLLFRAVATPDSLARTTSAPFRSQASPHSEHSTGGATARQQYNSHKLCAAVLVSSQFTAFALSKLINELCVWDEEMYFVRPGHLFASKGGASLNLSQEEVIRKFRYGELNVIMATRFIDSGLELPKCGLVVCFDPVDDFTSYLQSKGRGRVTHSSFLHLVEEGGEQAQFDAQFARFQSGEKVLVTRCGGHSVFADESDVEADVADDELSPYAPYGDQGVTVTMSKAINMVNRYCARLPSDSFTQLTPRWTLTCNSGLFTCSIKLPINSPYKERVHGEEMPTKKLAKMAAAMRTIEALHKSGELDSSMNPLGKTDCWTGSKHESVMLQEEKEEAGGFIDPSLIGSTKRRQYYYKKIAEKLTGCCVTADQPGMLYHIGLSLNIPLPDQQNTRGRPCYHPEDDPRGFAILTTKPLEQIPTFPLFTRSGEETVEFSLLRGSIVHTEEQLSRLQHFHHVLFQAVLRLEKEAVMKFRFDEAYWQALIVPVDKATSSIDWDIIDLVLSSFCPYENVCKVPPRMDSQGVFEFRIEDYRDTVVMPSYRNFDQPQHYYVAEIMAELGPRSPFPSELYSTFKDYYSKKYNTKITNLDQPLLDVDFTAIRLNLLVPRYVSHKGVTLPTASEERKRARRENLNQKQLLLPELCFRHPFPASVWRKAVCLPAVLYRLNNLLLAEELRRRIASSAQLGPVDLPDGFTFPGLELSFPCTESSEGRGSSSQGHGNVSASGGRKMQLQIGNNCCTGNNSGPDSQQSSLRCYVDSASLSETKLLSESFHDAASLLATALEKSAIAEEGCNDDCGELRPVGSELSLDEGADADDDEDDAESVDSFEGNVRFFAGEEEQYRMDKIDNSDNGASPALSANNSYLYQPSPNLLLQAVTMSCSNDFFNLERMETIGDSFLKFAVTVHHFLVYSTAHEGNLSFLRSKQVCNMNLYRLGKQKGLGDLMIGNKFEPHDNWIPPGFIARFDSRIAPEPIIDADESTTPSTKPQTTSSARPYRSFGRRGSGFKSGVGEKRTSYCLRIQQSLTDKSIADCVEALIGCYLTSRGHVVALRVMRWLGIDCMPDWIDADQANDNDKDTASLASVWKVPELLKPLASTDDVLLHGFDELEGIIKYRFNNRNYLIQAFTHASYHYNETTDCYQRLEFLGDAVLDYVITRFLYEDCKKHSPGVLTDLRSALVNNNIFAALAVKWGFYRFFKCCSPDLLTVIDRFVRYQKDLNNDDLDFITNEDLDTRDSDEGPTTLEVPTSSVNDEGVVMPTNSSTSALMSTGVLDQCEGTSGTIKRTEAIEIPKALGDIFESLAGAVFLDAGLSLDTVWRVFYRLMQERIERYTDCIPKSPVRELLEMEPEIAKFERPRRTGEGRIRVCVHVVGKGRFVGIGRNYRIAKSIAAKRALRVIKKRLAEQQANEMQEEELPEEE